MVRTMLENIIPGTMFWLKVFVLEAFVFASAGIRGWFLVCMNSAGRSHLRQIQHRQGEIGARYLLRVVVAVHREGVGLWLGLLKWLAVPKTRGEVE